MFYEKPSKNLPKFKTKTIKLDCSTSLSVDYDEHEQTTKEGKPCHVCNFRTIGSELVGSHGIKEILLPTSQATSDTSTRALEYTQLADSTFVKVWRYKYYSTANSKYMYMLIAYMSNKKLYYCNLFGNDPTFHPIGNYTFDTTPCAIMFRVNDEDVIAFSAPNTNLLVWYCDASPYEVSTTPTFLSICLCQDRLFAIDAKKTNLVRYSSNTNPLDWTTDDSGVDGAGEIDLGLTKGENRVVLSLLDNVYVIGDYNISKISTYSSKFVVSKVYSTSSKIYTDTAVVAGEDIYFVATDGLYRLDGYKVEKIDLKLSKTLFSKYQSYINTCYFENKIYIACSLKFNDGYDGMQSIHNNAIVEYDTISKKVTLFRGDDIAYMYPLQDLYMSKMVCLVYDWSGHYNKYLYELSEPIDSTFVHQKIYRTGIIDLGDKSKRKILKSIRFSNVECSALNVVVSNMSEEKTFSASAYKTEKIVNVDMSGYEFRVKIMTSRNVAIIASPILTFKVEE